MRIRTRRTLVGLLFLVVGVGGYLVQKNRREHRPYRTLSEHVWPEHDQCCGGGSDDRSAVSLHRHQPPNEEPYSLSFIEFDDQGYFWDAQQLTQLSDHVREAGKARGVLLIAFVHGWNHSAGVGDSNIACFEEVLKAVARMESANNRGAARAVVGVFVGWRGRVFNNDRVNSAVSFWNRLAVADRIGTRGDLARLLQVLRQLRSDVQGRFASALTITAHSMGARATFFAVRAQIAQDLMEARTNSRALTRMANMIMLVNPAFSAADYRVVHLLAQDLSAMKPSGREPVMVLMSSEADDVTRVLYPLGVRVTGWLQESKPEDRQLLWETAANHAPYVTHRLVLREGSPTSYAQPQSCGCPTARADQFTIARGRQRAERREALFQYKDIRVGAADGSPPFHMQLTPASTATPAPVMVVQADRQIIRHHGDMFNPLLVEFSTRITNASLDEQQRLEHAEGAAGGSKQTRIVARLTYPEDAAYSRDHLWVRRKGKSAEIGVTAVLVDWTGDPVYLTLPEVGAWIRVGESFGELEGTIGITELTAPVSGQVEAVNADLLRAPEKIRGDPQRMWLIRVRSSDQRTLRSLIDAAAYARLAAKETHSRVSR